MGAPTSATTERGDFDGRSRLHASSPEDTDETRLERRYWMALPDNHVETKMPRPASAAIAESASEQLTTARVSHAVRLAQAGDREALGFLYARYADNVNEYVRCIVRDPHDAEDVTQQVFAELVRVIGKYEEREVPFLAWILRVAHNFAVGYLPPPARDRRRGGQRGSPYRDRNANGALRSERTKLDLSRTAVRLRARR